MTEELTREDLSPTINTRIQDFAPGKSKVFVITSTPKKRWVDPIDSSTGSHQDEGHSVFINVIDPMSDYPPISSDFSSIKSH
jgi:hypothetical protein